MEETTELIKRTTFIEFAVSSSKTLKWLLLETFPTLDENTPRSQWASPGSGVVAAAGMKLRGWEGCFLCHFQGRARNICVGQACLLFPKPPDIYRSEINFMHG